MYRMNGYNGGTPRDRLGECRMCNATPRTETPAMPETDMEARPLTQSLAMFYFPEQLWQNLYPEDEGLIRGTIFKELDKPFYGPRCGGGCVE